MRLIIRIIFLLSFTLRGIAQPVKTDPVNPHYLNYKGNPVILVTSAEHYGAVLNRDFDYITYLNTLRSDGMNYTRIFTGSYVEIPGSFGIRNNTLAPAAGSFLAPWKRTSEPGLFPGENKFDLSQWEPSYFERLHSFIKEAGNRDIIVEITFFCSTYQDTYWERNPFNPSNNINGFPSVDRKKSNTLENGPLTEYQAALVRKIVTELNRYENIFFEIQNEPWADDPWKAMRTLRSLDPQGMGWAKWSETASPASLEWQKKMAAEIVTTEKMLPLKHIIAQNYTNFKHSLEEVDPDISILNFHYVWPEAVWMNYGWDRPVSFDESGFAGSSDTTYLRQAWQFMLAGGAVFNNLDYSFYVGEESGNGVNSAPGGGSSGLRKMLGYLRYFMNEFDYIKMKPDFDIVYHSPGLDWQALSEKGKQYAIFFTGKRISPVKLVLPKGSYFYTFTSPFTGKILTTGLITVKAIPYEMNLPEFQEMTALKITARN